jgi:hypothetical protein
MKHTHQFPVMYYVLSVPTLVHALQQTDVAHKTLLVEHQNETNKQALTVSHITVATVTAVSV